MNDLQQSMTTDYEFAIKSNPETTARELATTLGYIHSTIGLHFHDLDYRIVLTRWILHRL